MTATARTSLMEIMRDAAFRPPSRMVLGEYGQVR
jgi:hypothetical protein